MLSNPITITIPVHPVKRQMRQGKTITRSFGVFVLWEMRVRSDEGQWGRWQMVGYTPTKK